MTADIWIEASELYATQEEADTCFLLHALHAAKSVLMVVIVPAEDTDVLVLCLASTESFHIRYIRRVVPRMNHTRFIVSPN